MNQNLASHSGLSRLLENVRTGHQRRPEREDEIQRRIEFCLLWRPEDDVDSFQARNPQWSKSAINTRLGLIRRRLGAAKYQKIPPYDLAQAYLRAHRVVG